MATKHNITLSRRAALAGGASTIALAGTATVAVAAAPDAVRPEPFMALVEELRDASMEMSHGSYRALQVAADLIEAALGVDTPSMFLPVADPNDSLLLAELRERALREIGAAS